MTTKQSRPGLGTEPTGNAYHHDRMILPAELAHLYGVGGVSQTRVTAASRRGLVALRNAWPEVLTQMIRRAIQQAFQEALPAYWLRRSEQLAEVGTPWADAAALSCRRHAWLLAQGLPDDVLAEIDDVMGTEVTP